MMSIELLKVLKEENKGIFFGSAIHIKEEIKNIWLIVLKVF